MSLWSQYKRVDPDAQQRRGFGLKQTAGSRLKAATGRGSGSLRMKRRSRGKHDILKELSLFNPLSSLTHCRMSCEQSADGREHLWVRAGVSRCPRYEDFELGDGVRPVRWTRGILLHPHHLQIFYFILFSSLLSVTLSPEWGLNTPTTTLLFTVTFVLSSEEIFCHQKCFFLHQMVWK